MSYRHLIILSVFTILVILLVLWLGDEYSDESRNFLRALRHVL